MVVSPSLTRSPSIVEPPKLELKPLPDALKYAYLGPSESLEAIELIVSDVNGITPSIVMHRIHLEYAKPSRESQRRPTPIMQNVVWDEILKLLDVRAIYPISDSRWVSPVQVLTKKSRITIVKYESVELVITRIQIGSIVFTDYKKLNFMIRKITFVCHLLIRY